MNMGLWNQNMWVVFFQKMRVSKNGGTPIAGWFISWKIPMKMDDDWGY
jgi:hypothetical protein